eukprot:CAMPEP_0197175114 /NCGR_PEP_ID=MMETSP1423-20130617/1419_1 /TAXON_ID=476441 /ORGANISM="Pseudo-nitzschia heimii, Strain UNC1101" /LENGTH=79 /DNA_ID=CAMNT_0042624185 /DNA_START=85 /DNA_END=321 /DNA_ORIENTATION=+
MPVADWSQAVAGNKKKRSEFAAIATSLQTRRWTSAVNQDDSSYWRNELVRSCWNGSADSGLGHTNAVSARRPPRFLRDW